MIQCVKMIQLQGRVSSFATEGKKDAVKCVKMARWYSEKRREGDKDASINAFFKILMRNFMQITIERCRQEDGKSIL